VVCATDCVMLKLASQNFQRFLEICPELAPTLERVISVRTAQVIIGLTKSCPVLMVIINYDGFGTSYHDYFDRA
jgi:hypothetical protein